MSNGNRIHLPGGAAGAPSPNTPTLLTCAECGVLCMVPYAIFEAAARAHSKGCIGPAVKAIAHVLDHGTADTDTDPPAVQS